MRRIRQFLALTGLTTLEALRQPLCLLLTTTCALITALVPLLLMHKFGEDGKLARDSGLALHFVFGVFVAGYAASSSLAREIRSGTASVVLSKPVGRGTFFLAKFLGVAAVVILFSLCATLSTLLAERIAEKFYFTPTLAGYITDWRTGLLAIGGACVAYLAAGLINYITRRPFASVAFWTLLASMAAVVLISGSLDRMGRADLLSFQFEWRILPASVLVTIALLVLSAVALTLATRLDAVPTLALCSGALLAGLASDYVLGRHADASLPVSLLYRLVPNWQHFWVCDALNGGGTIPWTYVLIAAGYAAAYSAGVLCLGLASFRHMEMK